MGKGVKSSCFPRELLFAQIKQIYGYSCLYVFEIVVGIKCKLLHIYEEVQLSMSYAT